MNNRFKIYGIRPSKTNICVADLHVGLQCYSLSIELLKLLFPNWKGREVSSIKWLGNSVSIKTNSVLTVEPPTDSTGLTFVAIDEQRFCVSIRTAEILNKLFGAHK